MSLFTCALVCTPVGFLVSIKKLFKWPKNTIPRRHLIPRQVDSPCVYKLDNADSH